MPMTAQELITLLHDLDPSTLVTIKNDVGVVPVDDHVETAKLATAGETYSCVILNTAAWSDGASDAALECPNCHEMCMTTDVETNWQQWQCYACQRWHDR
jgi:hypothetical protein